MTATTDTSQTLIMRYRMSERDAHYGGGLVNGARSLLYMNDVAARFMTRLFNNRGRCTAMDICRFYAPVFAGDYLEFQARIVKQEGKRVTFEIRSFKIAYVPGKRAFDSTIDVYADPPMSAMAVYEYESRF